MLLQLLDPASNHSLDHPELRRELASMVELLHRLEQLAQEQMELHAESDEIPDCDVIDQGPGEDPQAIDSDVEEDDLMIGGHVFAFDPSEFSQAPPVSQPFIPDAPPLERDHGAPAFEVPVARAIAETESDSSDQESDENLERWWVQFNGNVSLERLARMRKVMSDSPFTIDARFSEITDGLIVMRLVTGRPLSTEQVDWIVRQVMDAVGLDREAAILSRE